MYIYLFGKFLASIWNLNWILNTLNNEKGFIIFSFLTLIVSSLRSFSPWAVWAVSRCSQGWSRAAALSGELHFITRGGPKSWLSIIDKVTSYKVKETFLEVSKLKMGILIYLYLPLSILLQIRRVLPSKYQFVVLIHFSVFSVLYTWTCQTCTYWYYTYTFNFF